MFPKYKSFKNKSEGLVLIASLLDKETNLGGLTRTAEIFGRFFSTLKIKTCFS